MGVLFALLAFQSIPDLVRDLAADAIDVRVDATRRLRLIGEEAIPHLEAAPGGDLEVQNRAALLIREINRESSLDPWMLLRYPGLKDPDAWYEALEIVEKRASLRLSFQTYALHLISQPAIQSRKAGVELLPRQPYKGMKNAIPHLVRAIEEWDPWASQDDSREWLQELVRLVMQRATPQNRPTLERARGGHWEGRQAIVILRASLGLAEATPTFLDLLKYSTPWLRIPAIPPP